MEWKEWNWSTPPNAHQIGIDELRTFSRFGRALFSNSERSHALSKDALSLSSLKDLGKDQTIEKATENLLDRAIRAGNHTNKEGVSQLFYRLTPQERFLITALHVGRWSYDKIARVLGWPPQDVTRTAWRLRIALSQNLGPGQPPTFYPRGSKIYAIDCPDYDPDSPWTQRFMDKTLQTTEKFFLEHHLMKCKSCRESLARCREIIYAVDAIIPNYENEQMLERSAKELQRVYQKTTEALGPPTLKTSFFRLIRYRDVQILVALAVIVLLLLP